MKAFALCYLIGFFFIFLNSQIFSQNIFLAGQTQNAIYSSQLEAYNTWYYDIDGDLVFDLHVSTETEPSGAYIEKSYFVEPLNDMKIVADLYEYGDTIYPKSYTWTNTRVLFGQEYYINGVPVDGWAANESNIFGQKISNSDTIYSWSEIEGLGIGNFFSYTASWTPCLKNIDIGIDTTINHGDSIVLHAGEGYTDYLWSTGDTTESISVYTEDYGTGAWTFSVVVGTNYCEYTDSINILILVIKPVYSEDKLIVFSNKANTGFTIKSLNGEPIESLVLFNEIGQVVMKLKPNNNSINISNLKTGLYILKVSSKDWITRKKLIQQ